ncbi:MAG: kelch repeat-containing protein, partial [Sedimentisphaerales bacterium]|nr:kelch repeat-containing protein [Sedimentisphaerales bacterium]
WLATNVGLANGGTGATLTDPNADRIMFWDDSLGATTWLTVGANLNLTGTTLSGETSNWQYIGTNAIRPTSTVGIIVSASSTFAGNLTVGTSTALFVDSGNGYVGIGTAAPNNLLQIQTANGSGAITNLLSLKNTNNAADTMSAIVFDIGGNYPFAAIAGGVSSWGDDAGYLSFYTRSATAYPTVAASEKMRITTTGNVGIGTTTPNTVLSINSASANNFSVNSSGHVTIGAVAADSGKIRFPNNISDAISFRNAANGGNVNFGMNSSDHFTFGQAIQMSGYAVQGDTSASGQLILKSTTGVGTSDAIVFQVGSNGGTEAMRINTSGNVGIGNTGPTSKLTVNGGDFKISSTGSATTTISSGVSTLAGGMIVNASSTINHNLTVGTSTALFVDSGNGYVGIGTTTPGVSLDVSGAIRTNNNFYVNGGISNMANLNDVININKNIGPDATPSWSNGASGGTARYEHTSVLYNGKIYSRGGLNGINENIDTIVDIYDIAGNSWSTGASGGTARYGATSVLYNGKIYSWGGSSSAGNPNSINTVDIYDIAGNSWSTGTAGGTARNGHTSVLYNGKIYSWGGSNGSVLNIVDIYNIAGNSWTTGTAGGTARNAPTSVLYNGKIYSWGGSD